MSAAPSIEVFRMTVADSAKVARMLTDADRAWLATLIDSATRNRVATGRALLRAVTTTRSGGAPDRVALSYRCAVCGGPHGKPLVQVPYGTDPIHASISHGGSVVLVALADVPVGVDVERCIATAFPGFDSVALSTRERAMLDLSGPGRRTELWVRKEAVLKVSGVGLSVPPSDVHIGCVATGQVRVSRSIAPGGWASVGGVPVPAGYRAAAAIAGRVTPSFIVRDGGPVLAAAVAAARTATA